MREKIGLIYDFFEVLKDAIVYIFIVCIIDVIAPLPFFRNLGFFPYVVFICIKAFVYSGLYGALTEIISGEEINIAFSSFISNAKRFCLQYLFFSIAISALFQALNHISPKVFPSYLIAGNLDLMTMLTMGLYINKKKYAFLIKSSSKAAFDPYQIFVLISLFLFNVFIHLLQANFKGMFLGSDRMLIFLSEYFNCVSFLYLIYIIQQRYPLIKEKFDFNKDTFFINPVDYGVYHPTLSPFHGHRLGTFTVLKALTPENYNVRVFNKVIWKNRYYGKNKLVGISCVTTNSYEAYKLAKEFKKRGSTVIMGGYHVSYMPDEALEYCDSVVIGYAEELWKEVLNDHENSSLKQKYYKKPQEVFTREVHDRIMTFSYKEISHSMELTRGCKYRCDFCPLHFFGNIGIKRASIDFLVERIKKMKQGNITFFAFNDHNIYNDPHYAKELFKALIPLNIKWGSFCSVDIADDAEALRLARESGCVHFELGFETFSGSGEMKKGGKYKYVNRYRECSKKIKNAGIAIHGGFIFGFDSDKCIDFFYMIKEVLMIRPKYSFLNFLLPMPGTDVYLNLLKEDRLNNLNWKGYYGGKLVFDHKNLSPQQAFILLPVLRLVLVLLTWQGLLGFIIIIFLLKILLRLIY